MVTNRIPKQAIDQKDEGTLDDRRKDGGTNFILRIKEQETRLTLHEHDDDDDDEKGEGQSLIHLCSFLWYILWYASALAKTHQAL